MDNELKQELLEVLSQLTHMHEAYCEERYNSEEEQLILSVDAKMDIRLLLDAKSLIDKLRE